MMNAEIYSGTNRMENWLIAQRLSGSTARTFTRKSDPGRIVVDDRSTLRALKDTKYLYDEIGDDITSDDSSDKWERRGSVVGAMVFAGIYSLTYPVTFIDGPLPIVDAAWAFGLVRFARAGHAIGGEVGSWID